MATSREAKRAEFRREALVHLDALHGLALRLTGGDESGAEDLVRETVRFRVPLVLADPEGLSHQEIAETMGVPVGAVKSRLSRTRRRLQEKLYEHAREMGYLR